MKAQNLGVKVGDIHVEWATIHNDNFSLFQLSLGMEIQGPNELYRINQSQIRELISFFLRPEQTNIRDGMKSQISLNLNLEDFLSFNRFKLRLCSA